MTSYILILSLILALFILPANAAKYGDLNLQAQRSASQQDNTIPTTTLKGNITESKELPQDFYGVWTVATKLIHADNPASCPKRTLEMWHLEKIDNIVTLSNPLTGAMASITVDKVINRTATFVRNKNSKNLKESEKITLTINKDDFYGTDVQISNKYYQGKLIKTEIAEYQLKGIRANSQIINELYPKR